MAASQEPEPPLSREGILAIFMSVAVLCGIALCCLLWSLCGPESYKAHITDRLSLRERKWKQTCTQDSWRAVDFKQSFVQCETDVEEGASVYMLSSSV